MKVHYQSIQKRVERMILREWKRRDPEIPKGKKRKVSIFEWPKAVYGYRVQEVSLMTESKNGQLTGMGGASYMVSDACVVPFLVERLVLEIAHFHEEDLDIYRDLLFEGIFGEEKK